MSRVRGMAMQYFELYQALLMLQSQYTALSYSTELIEDDMAGANSDISLAEFKDGAGALFTLLVGGFTGDVPGKVHKLGR